MDIKTALAGKNILITGPTKCLTTLLISKLLRDCDEINLIYLLASDPQKFNLEKYKKSTVFESLRLNDENALNKLCEFHEDRHCNEINVIFNCDQCDIFDEHIRHGLAALKRTKKLTVQASSQMPNLRSFIQVSSTFIPMGHNQSSSSSSSSQSSFGVIDEIVYSPMYDYDRAISAYDENDQQSITEIEKCIKKSNLFCFTNRLIENLIYDSRENIPVTIIRLSLLTPSVQEPSCGYIPNENSAMLDMARVYDNGTLRTIYGSSGTIDIIPIDFAVNSLITIAADNISRKLNECPVYNSSLSIEYPITWNEFLSLGKEIEIHYPSKELLWYPNTQINTIYLINLMQMIFLQFLPAIFYDFFLLCTMQISQKRSLLQAHKNTFLCQKSLAFILGNKWKWNNSNIKLLENKRRRNVAVSPSEQFKFNFNGSNLDYRKYVTDCIMAARQIININDDSRQKNHIKFKNANVSTVMRLNILFLVNLVLTVMFYGLLIFLFIQLLGKYGGLSNHEAHVFGCSSCSKFSFTNKF